jgi:hypothetical protein
MATRDPVRLHGLAGFFDCLVRRALGDLRVPGEGLAPYLALLLARFPRTDQLYALRDAAGRRIDSVVGLRLEAERAWAFDAPDFDPFRERRVRQHIGDYTLFMTGVFREHIERQSATGFYVREGRRAYQAVADFERSALRPEARLFGRLADEFERYAGALSYMKRVYLRPADTPPSFQPVLRLLAER